MDNYTIYCTEEQTRKALELGAPISKGPMIDIIRNEIGKHCFLQGSDAYWFPTAEQMLGWLEEQGIYAWVRPEFWAYNGEHKIGFVHIISKLGNPYIETNESNEQSFHKTFKEATLAAIDAALDYLVRSLKEK